VVLFEMLTGRAPWSRDVLLAGARRRGDFVLPAEVVAGAPNALVARVQEHLDALGDPDPEKRPTTEGALAEAFALRAESIAAGLT
jgi:hypothetical protein